jgi:transcriptional regulator with XRE-family HTH domain
MSIRLYRKQKGLSQRELGKLIGVDHSHISKWETGSINPGADNLLKLSEVLGVSTSALLDNSGHSNPYSDIVSEDVQRYFGPQMADFKIQEMRFLREYLRIHLQFMNRQLSRTKRDQQTP